MYQKIGQGWALAVPSGPWCLTIPLGWLGHHRFFFSHKLFAEHPGFHRLRALGFLKFFSKHSLIGTLHQSLATMVQLVRYFEVALETVLVLWRITLQDFLRDVFWPSLIFNLIIANKKIKSLYLSVNVFSTKVFIGETIFNISYWRRGCHFTWSSEPTKV